MEKKKNKSRVREVLSDFLLNKGIAFNKTEREELGLDGLLPYHVSTLDEQVKKSYSSFSELPTPLSKYSFLSALQNNNEVLFFKLVSQHVDEMLSLIYSLIVGDVSLKFSKLYSQQRGVYFSFPLMDSFDQIVDNIPHSEIDFVADRERVLGLGDLGAGGMAISNRKLSLYTLFGGEHPGKVLPIFLENHKSCSEADPGDLIKWTSGEAIIATGSPFEVQYQGKTYPIAQCNNVYIFPGVGLSVIACGSKKVTDEMCMKAAQILSDHAPILKDPHLPLFPSFKELKEISIKIAIGVVQGAQEQRHAKKTSYEEIEKMVDAQIWMPYYNERSS
jgi:malic enzyme